MGYYQCRDRQCPRSAVKHQVASRGCASARGRSPRSDFNVVALAVAERAALRSSEVEETPALYQELGHGE